MEGREVRQLLNMSGLGMRRGVMFEQQMDGMYASASPSKSMSMLPGGLDSQTLNSAWFTYFSGNLYLQLLSDRLYPLLTRKFHIKSDTLSPR